MKSRLLLFLINAFIFSACTSGRLDYPAATPDNRSLNNMLILQPGDTLLPLKTFIQNPHVVDSATVSCEAVQVEIDKQSSQLRIHVDKTATGIADLKLYIQHVPYSVPCAFSIPRGKALVDLSVKDSCSHITTNKYNLQTLTINVLNGADATLVYWQNYLLPQALYLLQPKQLLISIPEEAAAVPRSYIRIWTYNRAGVSRELRLPLAFGKPVVDSTQLIPTDMFFHAKALTNLPVFPDDKNAQNKKNTSAMANALKKRIHAKMTDLISNNPLYLYGDSYCLQRQQSTAIYAQKYFDREMLLFINNSPKPKEFKLTLPEIFISKTFRAMWGTKFDFDDKTVTMIIDPYSAEFLSRYDSN